MVRRHLNRPHRAVFLRRLLRFLVAHCLFPGWCRERRDPTLAIRVLIRVMLMFRFSLFSFLLQRRRRLPRGRRLECARRRVLVSTLRGGQLGLVYPNGRYRRFSTCKGLITTSGMLVDAERNRVLVCNEVGSPSALRPVRAIAWRRCWSSISIPASCSRRTISHR